MLLKLSFLDLKAFYRIKWILLPVKTVQFRFGILFSLLSQSNQISNKYLYLAGKIRNFDEILIKNNFSVWVKFSTLKAQQVRREGGIHNLSNKFLESETTHRWFFYSIFFNKVKYWIALNTVFRKVFLEFIVLLIVKFKMNKTS